MAQIIYENVTQEQLATIKAKHDLLNRIAPQEYRTIPAHVMPGTGEVTPEYQEPLPRKIYIQTSSIEWAPYEPHGLLGRCKVTLQGDNLPDEVEPRLANMASEVATADVELLVTATDCAEALPVEAMTAELATATAEAAAAEEAAIGAEEAAKGGK